MRKFAMHCVTTMLFGTFLALCFVGGFHHQNREQARQQAQLARQIDSAQNIKLTVQFSPNGGCEKLICQELDQAKELVQMHSYSFTSEPIEKALEACESRGVKVQMVIDSGQSASKYCLAKQLKATGADVRLADCNGLAHNKVILIDSSIVITGSFNWSYSAEHLNQENIICIKGRQDVVDQYLANFEDCFNNGTEYDPTTTRYFETDLL